MRTAFALSVALLTNTVTTQPPAKPALPSCSKFASGRIHVPTWTATLANGRMSAPLPDREHYSFYFNFAVAQDDVETYDSPEKFSVVIPQDVTHLSYEYRIFLFGKAEHANGYYYFSGFYEDSGGMTVSSWFRRLNTLEVVLSGTYCLDDDK
jgi:hypothetical protein